MRWSIRNQILLPLVMIQLVVVVGVSTLAAWSALNRVQLDVDDRLSELSHSLENAAYPLNQGVLSQLRGLSGAEFILRDERGQLATSTFPEEVTAELAGASEPPVHENLPLRVQGREYRTTTIHPGGPSRGMTVQILSPDDAIRAARREAVRGPILLGALTLLLTATAMILVARRIGGRIQGIQQQVARVAEGDFNPIPLPRRDDELRELSASVNHMGEELERFSSRIRESERALLIKQLAGGIAHQLRNSLTGARLAVQLHLRRCATTEDDSLEVALRQLTLTEEQIRGLAALIRDEHRPPDPGSLDTVIREVLALVRPICDHRQLQLKFQGTTEGLLVRDQGQIRAALLNLILNAIEAAGTGGSVEIVAEGSEALARIAVYDNGPGVPEGMEREVFLPFRTTKADGMGLGLALAKQAAENHQGAVTYSRSQGRTCFLLTCRGMPGTEKIPETEKSVTEKSIWKSPDRPPHEPHSGH